VVSVPVVRPLAFPSGSSGAWCAVGGLRCGFWVGGGLRGFVAAVRLWSAGVV